MKKALGTAFLIASLSYPTLAFAEPPAKAFNSILPTLKTKTHTSILLPAILGVDLRGASHAVLNEADPTGYEIDLYYKLGIGDAGFAAMFAAEANPKFSPEELPNIKRVRLADGIDGYFRPVSCGGSCAPANIWWTQNGTQYQIQLKLPSDHSDEDQQKAIAKIANSAILGRAR